MGKDAGFHQILASRPRIPKTAPKVGEEVALLPDNLKRTRPATAFFSVEQAAADLAAKEEAAAKKPRKEVKGGKVGKSNKTNKQGNKEDKAAAASTPPPATEKSPASQPPDTEDFQWGSDQFGSEEEEADQFNFCGSDSGSNSDSD
jgi:hypothetical protein